MNAVGIDISKQSLTVSRNATAPVTIKYTDPTWHETLAEMCHDAVVLFEPTGYYYAQPIIRALEIHRSNAELWLCNHQTAGAQRALQGSRAKTDDLDSIALSQLARKLCDGVMIRGCRPYLSNFSTLLAAMRLIANDRRRLTKERTRALNRFKQVSHAIYPTLSAKSKAWRNAILTGYDTLELLRQHTPGRMPEGMKAARWGSFRKLVKEVPLINVPPVFYETCHNLAHTITDIEQRRAILDQQLTEYVEQNFAEMHRRASVIPHWTPIATAYLAIATNGDPTQYTRAGFTANAGVAPKTNQSGSSLDRTQPAGIGYRPFRDAIFMTVLRLIDEKNGDNVILRYYKSGHNASACRRKFANMLWGILQSETPHFDAAIVTRSIEEDEE